MNRKGQGALEYLILIGGALIVAAIVLTILPGLASKGETGAAEALLTAQCAAYNDCVTCQNADVSKDYNYDCEWNTTTKKCMPCGKSGETDPRPKCEVQTNE